MKTIAAFIACLILSAVVNAEEMSLTILGRMHLIDRPIAHMKGELDSKEVTVSSQPTWITGISVAFESPTVKAIPDSMLCHAGLHLAPSKKERGWTLLLSQGKTSIHFPDGFGLPVPANRSVNAYNMAIAPNFRGPSFQVTPKTTVTYVRDSKDIKPLYIYWSGTDVTTLGPGVSVYKSGLFSPKSFDTTIHFANIHVHAYAKSIEFRDVTDHNQLLFKFKVVTDSNGEILDTPAFSWKDGMPFLQSHKYQLTVTYDNTSGHPIDVMAMVYLYVLNRVYTL